MAETLAEAAGADLYEIRPRFGKAKEDLKVSISKLATVMEGGLLNGNQTKESLKSWMERL